MSKLTKLVRECSTETEMLKTVQMLLRSAKRLVVSVVDEGYYRIESITTQEKAAKFKSAEAKPRQNR